MNKKKLLAVSLIALSILAISSISITVAWYYNGVYGQVDAVNVSLKGEPNLLISTSTDISSFKETLTKDDLMKVESFSPVSSMYSSRWISKKEDKPKFVDSYDHLSEGSEIYYSEKGFFSQDLYLLSKDDVYVTINAAKFSFLPNEEKNLEAYEKVKDKYPELSKEQILTNLNNITKSLRVSVLYADKDNYQYVIVDPYKATSTYFTGILDTDINGYFDYSNETNKEVIYGEYSNEDKAIFDPGVEEDTPYIKPTTCYNSSHKAHIELFNLEKSVANGFIPSIEPSSSLSEVENVLKVPLKDENPSKITLSIYLEGWDVDNTSLNEYASFYTDISFKIKGEII